MLAGDTDGAVSGRPLSANSVRHLHSVLDHAPERGIAWGLIAYNPARRATPPPARRPCIHLPSTDEVVRLIEGSASRQSQPSDVPTVEVPPDFRSYRKVIQDGETSVKV
jgi:hypothetical protein